jgi:hypothetical protein
VSFHSRAGTTSSLSGLLESRIARVTAFALAVMIMTSTLVSMVGVGAAQADSVVTLTATAAKSVLAGASSTVTLTATNNNVTNLYNAAFSFTLPVGASYLPGSTTPSTVGDPQVITVIDNSNPANPVSHQVLVWNNVQDLPANDVATLSFGLKADSTVFPVGSAVTGSGGAYAQTDPRLLVKFDPNGAAVSGSYTNSDTASPAQTAVTALKVTKTEPSPESELMRGVHDHPTTYAITVDNTNVAATNGVTVVDYIPAALEFLGCGGVDNGPREYPNAASLASTPTVPNCVVPVSVATVLNPAGQPAGVYTAVTWNLADFGAGATKTIVYAAGIPLRSNTMTFAGGTPTADSLGQEANLDNNTGASTRHDGIGQAYTNTAIATGTYTGPVANGASTAVHAEGSATVKSMDLSVVKSNKTPVFDSGSNATYDLLVRTSEYTDVASVTVTDIIPNGLCPLLPVGTSVVGILPADCTGHAPVSNATVNSETVNSDGSFSVVFTPTVNTAANANFIIEYTALMRTNYQGSVNAPTSSGDSYVNTVSITGQSTPITALGSGPTNTVTDGSQSTITSTPPTIDKQVLPRTDVAGGASDCTTHVGQYVSGSSAVPNFQLGDFVCFQLTVNFSKTSKTKNAQVSDFVPVGTSYHDYVVGAQSTVPVNQVVQSSSAPPTWSIGAAVGSNPTGDKFVDKGAVLVLYVSALVTKPSATTTVDITDNLMKYRQTNTRGAVFALRTQAGFSIAPSAAVSLAKGVTAVNGALVSGAPAASAAIKEQDTADFRLVARNIGTADLRVRVARHALLRHLHRQLRRRPEPHRVDADRPHRSRCGGAGSQLSRDGSGWHQCFHHPGQQFICRVVHVAEYSDHEHHFLPDELARHGKLVEMEHDRRERERAARRCGCRRRQVRRQLDRPIHGPEQQRRPGRRRRDRPLQLPGHGSGSQLRQQRRAQRRAARWPRRPCDRDGDDPDSGNHWSRVHGVLHPVDHRNADLPEQLRQHEQRRSDLHRQSRRRARLAI